MILTIDNVHKELLNFRIKHGITQEKVCASTGIARATITSIENDKKKPRATTLFKLNEYLKLFP